MAELSFRHVINIFMALAEFVEGFKAKSCCAIKRTMNMCDVLDVAEALFDLAPIVSIIVIVCTKLAAAKICDEIKSQFMAIRYVTPPRSNAGRN